MERFVAYYRVSTEPQGRSGLGLEAQQAAVRAYVGERPLIAEHTDIESGKYAERPALLRALAEARNANAILVIAKLDRLARNVAFIANPMESGVRFVAADMPEANALTLHAMAAVAQYEREAISQRTKAALAVAKARGRKLGNPSPAASLAKGKETLTARADAFAAAIRPLIEQLRANGVSTYRDFARGLELRPREAASGRTAR